MPLWRRGFISGNRLDLTEQFLCPGNPMIDMLWFPAPVEDEGGRDGKDAPLASHFWLFVGVDFNDLYGCAQGFLNFEQRWTLDSFTGNTVRGGEI